MELNKKKKGSKKRSLPVVQETEMKVPEVPTELVIHIAGLPCSNIISCVKDLFSHNSIQLPEFDEQLIKQLDSAEAIRYRNLKTNAVSDFVLEGPESWSILTTDIIYAIISFLYPIDVLNLLLVNKKLFLELDDAPIWKYYSDQQNSSLTSSELRKLIFSERWTYNYMHTYIDYGDNNYTKDKNIKFIVYPLDVFLQTYKNILKTPKEFGLFVADVSKHNTTITEIDSTINYHTKFNQIFSMLEVRHAVTMHPCVIGQNDLRQQIEAGEQLPLAEDDLFSNDVDFIVTSFIAKWFQPFHWTRRGRRIWNHNSPLTIEALFNWSHPFEQQQQNKKNGPRNGCCCMVD